MRSSLLACGLAAVLIGQGAPARKPSTSTPAKKKSSTRRAPAVTAKARQEAAAQVSSYLDGAGRAQIENPAALVAFYEQLFRQQAGLNAGPLRILHYGDSHTASDDWPGTLRILFQTRFGDGGSGYALPGRPWRGYRRLDLRSASSRGWKTEGLARDLGDGLHGLGGVSLVARRPGETITLDAECDRMELFFWRRPDGGRLELYDNDVPVDVIATDGQTGPGFAEYDAGPGFHRFRLRTLDRSPVRVFGWVVEKPSGVTYETLGINGAQASVILDWDEHLLASHIARRDPALIVLAYGTNEAANRNWTLDNYREMFGALLRRLRRASPPSSILVIGPPDRFVRSRGRWIPYENVDRIVAAEREAASREGCAFLDLRQRMGGKGAMRNWMLAGLAQTDHVHFTASGYRQLGDLLFRDLMADYDIYTEARGRIAAAAGDGYARENR